VAVVLTAAVAASVLTGALMVGDSVRGSLRDLTLNRLGGIDFALIGGGFFREELGSELAEDADFAARYGPVSAAILMQGSIVEPQSGRRAARVNVQGIDGEFASFFPGTEGALDLDRRDGQLFASLIVNRSLADALAVGVGDSVLLYLERPSEAPRASLMGEKDPADQLESVRLSVVSVLEDEGPGRFQLTAHQSQPLVAYARLRDLQRELDRRGLANALVVGAAAAFGNDAAADPEAVAADLEERIRSHARAEDFSLALADGGDHLRITTSQIVFGDELAGASEVLRPDHSEVANAIGAAIAQVGGQMERVYSLEGMGREEAVADCSAAAIARAVSAGADPTTIEVVEIDEIPLTYVPSNATRVRVKAVGDLPGLRRPPDAHRQ